MDNKQTTEVPKWVIEEADREYPKGTHEAYSKKQAHIKARMLGIEESIEFGDWLWHNTYEQRWKEENRRFYNKDGEPKTTAQLHTIYQQQNEKI